MRYTLTSDKLVLNVNSKGAELCSIKNKQGYEYLWQGDPEIWPRQAPVLFPIVGKLKDNRYSFGDSIYTMSQHGFARDLEYSLVKQEPQELVFELNSDEISRSTYPFDFRLTLKYLLKSNILLCSYEVKNTGEDTMYFSIGAHPGFNILLSKHHGKCYPYLEFKKSELVLSNLSGGLLSGEKHRLSLSETRLSIHAELFKNDALVAEGGQIEGLSLCLDAEGRKIDLSCSGWPYFGIWSKPDPKDATLKFLCLEPWFGVADNINHDGLLKNKSGILHLDAGKTFDAAFELSFF